MKIALILGGALNKDGELSQYVKKRCLLATSENQRYDYYIASSRYSLNVPPKLEKNGYIIYENKKISDYLKCLGIASDQIILESSSTDTIGSALFCRIYIQTLFLNDPKFLEVALITSEFHMPRSYEIFHWAFCLKPCAFKFKIQCMTANDSGINKEREQHELVSLLRFKSEWQDITKLQAAFTKLLSNHDNYSNIQVSKNINNENLNY